jgi:hypothetical protein
MRCTLASLARFLRDALQKAGWNTAHEIFSCFVGIVEPPTQIGRVALIFAPHQYQSE